MKPDLKLREAVFRKMGWIVWGQGRNSKMIKADLWKDPPGNNMGADLPPIETSWEVCAEYLVPFMTKNGLDWEKGGWNNYFTEPDKDWRKIPTFAWVQYPNYSRDNEMLIKAKAEIKNDNIALAACQAFMEVKG